MRRPHPDLVVVLVAVLGVAALHVTGALLEPPLVALPDAATHEGGRIAVDARVLQVRASERGRFLVLAADGYRLSALGGPGDGPRPGDEVLVVGIVTRLDAGLGLSIERIDVKRAAGDAHYSPAEIAQNPRDFEGARVTLLGEPRAGQLHGGGARLRLSGEDAPALGGWRLATGTVYYDEGSAAFALRVDSWSSP